VASEEATVATVVEKRSKGVMSNVHPQDAEVHTVF
jgi:hypothetical protein